MSDHPSTPPRLEDLRKPIRHHADEAYPHQTAYAHVTPADLLAVLTSMGAETVGWMRDDWGIPVVGYFDSDWWDDPEREFVVIRKDALGGTE